MKGVSKVMLILGSIFTAPPPREEDHGGGHGLIFRTAACNRAYVNTVNTKEGSDGIK